MAITTHHHGKHVAPLVWQWLLRPSLVQGCPVIAHHQSFHHIAAVLQAATVGTITTPFHCAGHSAVIHLLLSPWRLVRGRPDVMCRQTSRWTRTITQTRRRFGQTPRIGRARIRPLVQQAHRCTAVPLEPEQRRTRRRWGRGQQGGHGANWRRQGRPGLRSLARTQRICIAVEQLHDSNVNDNLE